MSTRSLSRDEVRAFDRRAIARGIPGIVLMENAARGATDLLLSLGAQGPFGIVCGKGNNAGDGFVMARLLAERGYPVFVELTVPPDQLSGDAATAFEALRRTSVPLNYLNEGTVHRLRGAEWVIDAVLGTGTRGTVRPPFLEAIEAILAAARPVFAVDLPSGLDCDTGQPLGIAVRADHTATFVARKKGFDDPASRPYTGEVHVVSIGVPWPESAGGPSAG